MGDGGGQLPGLAKGPVSVKVREVVVSLMMDAEGLPEITVEKKGKKVKSLPAEAKKNAEVEVLQERKAALKKSPGG